MIGLILFNGCTLNDGELKDKCEVNVFVTVYDSFGETLLIEEYLYESYTYDSKCEFPNSDIYQLNYDIIEDEINYPDIYSEQASIRFRTVKNNID